MGGENRRVDRTAQAGDVVSGDVCLCERRDVQHPVFDPQSRRRAVLARPADERAADFRDVPGDERLLRPRRGRHQRAVPPDSLGADHPARSDHRHHDSLRTDDHRGVLPQSVDCAARGHRHHQRAPLQRATDQVEAHSLGSETRRSRFPIFYCRGCRAN